MARFFFFRTGGARVTEDPACRTVSATDVFFRRRNRATLARIAAGDVFFVIRNRLSENDLTWPAAGLAR